MADEPVLPTGEITVRFRGNEEETDHALALLVKMFGQEYFIHTARMPDGKTVVIVEGGSRYGV
ncbi:MAG: hypothetical protein LUQ09_07715 [Methanomassiliicoccales archaeon]|nr:hypothetical protein [Methanomassiliicoccales archaeon]